MNSAESGDIVVKQQNMRRLVFTFLVNRAWWIVPVVLGAAILSWSFMTSMQSIRAHSHEVATESARNMYRMIKLTRLWNASHGGVYVPVTEDNQPNPYLNVPDRDVITTDNKQLTLVNPAFMTRQLSELALANDAYQMLFHITSLKPIRSKNVADEWERQALVKFEKEGLDEVAERMEVNGSDVFRFMGPLVTEAACLTCHAEQGYKLGDIRGGISVTFKSEQYFSGNDQLVSQSLIQHASVFVFYVIILVFLLERIRSQWLLLADAEQTQKGIIRERTAELELSNKRLLEENRERILAEQSYRAINDSVFDAIVSTDSAGFVTSWNKGAENLFGFPLEEMLGHNIAKIIPESFRQRHSSAMKAVSMGEPRKITRPIEVSGLHRDGRLIPVEVSLGQHMYGDSLIYSAVIRDITERHKADQVRRKEREFLQMVINSISDPVMVISPDYKVLLKNDATDMQAQRLGLEDTSGEFCYQAFYGKPHPCSMDKLNCPFDKIDSYSGEQIIMHKSKNADGSDVTLEIRATPIWQEDGSLKCIVTIYRDISAYLDMRNQLKDNEIQLLNLTHYDTLTSLPNRELFISHLDQGMRSADRFSHKLAVMHIDLDKFKNVNDSLGHSAGNLLLEKMAATIREILNDNDMLARISGDEFLVMLGHVKGSEDAASVAQLLIDRLEQPFDIDGYQIYQSVSIGIGLFPRDGEDTETILRNVEAAMNRAKENGRNRFMFYTEVMTKEAYEHVLLAGRLRQAIENDEFVVFYQPQVDVASGQLVGAEALVRWLRDGEIVPAGVFIPLAEETGLIEKLGMDVLIKACRQLKQWQLAGLVSPTMKMSVNLSARQLENPNLVDEILDVLNREELATSLLELEITESLIMHDPEYAIKVFSRIRQHGIELSIDDFGTGYSSLSYIKNLPVTKLKIDRSFVQDLPDSHDDVVIARSIIAMAHSLELKVIAEGVENTDQLSFLNNEGCNLIQGYYFSEPVSAEDFINMMESWPIVSA